MMVRHAIIFYLAFFMLTLSPARADENIKILTEENVTAFIEDTTAMTAGSETGLAVDQIVDYLNMHVADNAHFKTKMTYAIPGYPEQTNVVELEKADFISTVEKGANKVSNYENQIEILSITLSKGDRLATVRTKNTEAAAMDVSGQGGSGQSMPVDGTSTCTQVLMLQDGVIKMLSADCETQVSFSGMDMGEGGF